MEIIPDTNGVGQRRIILRRIPCFTTFPPAMQVGEVH
jgi:hypothetical protein